MTAAEKKAKAAAKAALAITADGHNPSSFDLVKALCEKAMGHGLVATEEEKDAIDAALEELEGLQ